MGNMKEVFTEILDIEGRTSRVFLLKQLRDAYVLFP